MEMWKKSNSLGETQKCPELGLCSFHTLLYLVSQQEGKISGGRLVAAADGSIIA